MRCLNCDCSEELCDCFNQELEETGTCEMCGFEFSLVELDHNDGLCDDCDEERYAENC